MNKELFKALKLLSDDELSALISVPSIGRKTVFKIVESLRYHEASFGEFWGGLYWKSGNFSLSNKQIDSIKKFKKEYTISSYAGYLEERGIKTVSLPDRLYPPLLKKVSDPPLVLFVKGSSKILKCKAAIGIVGTRRITSYGTLAVKKIVSELASSNPMIISGFMYGVDAAAHQQAMRQGLRTVGVLGFGYDHMFPRRHQKLFDEMAAEGNCFVSEFPPFISPSAGNFPLRNRIIAGMSQAVVVIEAAEKSGSRITARLALDEGREVFAVPGPITSPYSEGTKCLIKDGALLISSGKEIIDELERSYPDCWKNHSLFAPQENLGEAQLGGRSAESAEQKIYGMLIAQPLSTEALSKHLQLSIVQLSTLLTVLELKGRIVKEGMYWKLEG